jgi:hypothetical protein
MGHFRLPFQKEKNVEEKPKSKTGAKIIFWIIVAMLAYAILSQVF